MSRIVALSGSGSTGFGVEGVSAKPTGSPLAPGTRTDAPGTPLGAGPPFRARTIAPRRAPPTVAPSPITALSTNGRTIPRWTRKGGFFGGSASARSWVAHLTQNSRVEAFGVPQLGHATSPACSAAVDLGIVTAAVVSGAAAGETAAGGGGTAVA